jgi:hypothetical protein
MMRKLAVVGTVTGVLLTASVAGAQSTGQGFGQKGEFIFSADRLVPVLSFTGNKVTSDNPNSSISTTGSGLSLLWGNNSVFGGVAANGAVVGFSGGGNSTFYTTPRVGFDYVLIPNLTIGGDLFVFFTLGTTETSTRNNVSTNVVVPSANAFGLAPRVGYIFGISPLLSFWLRGGLSYYHGGTSIQDANCNNQNDTTSLNLFGLDIDPQLVISPAPHFSFTAGPAVDIGFAGSASATNPGGAGGGGNCNSSTTVSGGYSSYNIGLTGALVGWF